MALTTIFAEQDLVFSSAGIEGLYLWQTIPAAVSLTEGEEYTVVWDDTQHKCTAIAANFNGVDGLGLGNFALAGLGEDTEEPFLFGSAVDGSFSACYTTERDATNKLAIYQGIEDDAGETEETHAPNDVVILNYSQTPVNYDAVPKVWLTHPDSTEEAPVLVPFTYGELLEDTEIAPDFSAGDMKISIPDGSLVKEATILKPEALIPENVRYGVNIGGIAGKFLGDTEEVEVELSMADGDQVILPSADGKSLSKVTVKKPDTLIPTNIAKDVEIGGVTGTHEGGGGEIVLPPETRPIRFYDPYGKIIYSYTREEAEALEELPTGPTLSGLTFDRWTHTLEEIKNTVYFADVGPMYKSGSTPVTVLIIETLAANKSVTVCLDMWSSSYKATINWGDGSTSSLTGSTSSAKTASHTFTAAGIHIITVTVTAGLANLGSTYSTTYRGVLNTSVSNSASITTGTPSYELLSVLVGSYESSYPVCVSTMVCNQRLRFLSTYNGSKRNSAPKKYFQCPSLKVIAGNTAETLLTSSQQAFYGDTGLQRLWVSYAIPADVFTCCDSLKEVMYDVTSIADTTMNSKWPMLMLTETPPTISAASPTWGTYPIYVPDSAVEAYKAASKWADAAAYIFPASLYSGV